VGLVPYSWYALFKQCENLHTKRETAKLLQSEELLGIERPKLRGSVVKAIPSNTTEVIIQTIEHPGGENSDGVRTNFHL
jgi:hypothetical protein